MKTGRNLQEVLVELDRQNKAKQDFISPAQGMHLREDGHTFELNHLTTDRQMTFGTTSLFHRQVASALGIPAKYYDLMQSQKPELLAENVNAWFADRTSSYMVRSMDYGSGQVARALLSERYRRIDNMEIATSVLPLFAGNDQYEVMFTVRWCSEVNKLTSTGFRVLFRGELYDITSVDPMNYGKKTIKLHCRLERRQK